jgi:RNA:NAD 2'-phosphotransferase (TPT1/KptA family)
VKLRHATLAKNLPGILRRGLLCSKSRGKKKVVWLHAPAASSWATLHTVKRHGRRVEEVVILEVDVPRSWLRRSRRRLWYCGRDIPPGRIRHVFTFGEVAGTSAES